MKSRNKLDNKELKKNKYSRLRIFDFLIILDCNKNNHNLLIFYHNFIYINYLLNYFSIIFHINSFFKNKEIILMKLNYQE